MAIVQVRFPSGTAFEVAQKNPILGRGEPFYELDTGAVKIGDGTQRYLDLPYAGIVLTSGPPGADGDEGPAGRGIVSIVPAGDLALRFNMSDATATDVTLPVLEKADEDRQAAQAAKAAAEQSAQDAFEQAERASEVVGTGVPNATPVTKGGIKLAGDLGGTWEAPTVPGLADKAEREFGDVIAVHESGDITTLPMDHPGLYQIHGGAGFVINMPSTNDLWWNVLVVAHDDIASKIVIAASTTSAAVYVRLKYGTTWSSWTNIAGPYSAMSVTEGSTGTSTTTRAVRADYLKQIINHHITGAAATPATAHGQALAKSADAADTRTLIGAENAALKGQPNGYAGLDTGGKVPASQLPSYVDDVLEFADEAAFPATGEAGKIYIALDTDKQFRWSGTAYREISKSPVTSVAGKIGAVTLARADVSDSSAIGRALMGASTAEAARAEIGAGVSNLQLGDTSAHAMPGNRIQRVASLPAGGGTAGVLYCIPKP